MAYTALVRSQLAAIETRVADAYRAVAHVAETDAVTDRAARRQIRGLESRIHTAYRTHIERELAALETRIETGYREIETDARVQAAQSEARRLRIAVVLLLVVLGVTLVALAVGVL